LRADPVADQDSRDAVRSVAMDDDILVADAAIETAGDGSTHADDRRWYVIHTYSGYENKVKTNLEHRVESMGVQDRIYDVVIPTEEEVEIKDGQRRTVQRKVFPGYVLVQMMVNDEGVPPNEPWYVVRNTPGVTGFVGVGNHPSPLEDPEVRRILRRMKMEAPRIRVS